MKIAARFALVSWLLLLASASLTLARDEPPDLTIPDDLILQRFTVAKGGDPLVIPVKFDGAEHLFLVDTGTTDTILSDEFARNPVATANVPIRRDLPPTKLQAFRSPKLMIGELAYEQDFVRALDLTGLRTGFDTPIDGILGMDFLGNYAISIDYDKGELLFLKSVPEKIKETVESILIFWRIEEKRPEVKVEISPGRQILSLIDTGSIGMKSGAVDPIELKPLVQSGGLREIGSSESETAGGTVLDPIYRGKTLRVGGFTITNPILSEHRFVGHLGILGNRFWSRFRVIFDFPNLRAYLVKGRNFEREDLSNSTGIQLWHVDGTIKTRKIAKDSPAESAGVKDGETVVRIGDLQVGQASLYELRKRLAQGGRIRIDVLRDQNVVSLEIPPSPPEERILRSAP